MRLIILTLFLLGLFNQSSGQFKIVKLDIDSTKIYFRYFYKSKNVSGETLNDSVRLVGRKITEDKFYLDKFNHKQKSWTRIYRIEPAKDSLSIKTMTTDKTGKHKIETLKEPYYNSFLIDN